MSIDNIFDIDLEPRMPCIMSQKEFVEKTKAILDKIASSYSMAWDSRTVKDDEYPDESVCENCTGCGRFMYNGEETDCYQNPEQGYCAHRVCNYDYVGMDVEAHIESIHELLSVDEII